MRMTVIGAGIVVQMLVAGAAEAAPSRDVTVTFFAERALKTEVGERTLVCGNGGVHMRGRATPYYVRSQSSCPTGPHSIPSTVSCHFTQAGCSANLARMIPETPKKPGKAPHKGM
ncbi:hypothetical protein HL653_20030 [Sphingomonas sp. AP4-R1]|uniref:hypothetical protein n=1 Tax=Sphingomonas sp. AP4-R1 TaxID=2735134 RepID=UPI001493DDB9|nr:hypothetical protein [Sphingomonas sp. AP4-R1]QJU59735.1 hypothetical protein HL653_20030 [Sphingomonas sp. AP4-R1]